MTFYNNIRQSEASKAIHIKSKCFVCILDEAEYEYKVVVDLLCTLLCLRSFGFILILFFRILARLFNPVKRDQYIN